MKIIKILSISFFSLLIAFVLLVLGFYHFVLEGTVYPLRGISFEENETYALYIKHPKHGHFVVTDTEAIKRNQNKLKYKIKFYLDTHGSAQNHIFLFENGEVVRRYAKGFYFKQFEVGDLHLYGKPLQRKILSANREIINTKLQELKSSEDVFFTWGYDFVSSEEDTFNSDEADEEIPFYNNQEVSSIHEKKYDISWLEISNMKTHITTNKQNYQVGEPILLTFLVENTTNEMQKLLPWQTPLENELSANVFGKWYLNEEQKHNLLKYKGRKMKRPAPTPTDYLSLAPKAKQSVTIDIAKYYDFTGVGTYQLQYKENELNGLPLSNRLEIFIK